jgi:uncharacterized protein (DUF924 family)
MQNEISPQTVLTFWFETLAPQQWWVKDAALDQTIREQFSELHGAATRCELYGWRHSAAERLAEVIVLDQFSRNIYRETPQAFSQDAQALVLAQEAIRHSSTPQPALLFFTCLVVYFSSNSALFYLSTLVERVTPSGSLAFAVV